MCGACDTFVHACVFSVCHHGKTHTSIIILLFIIIIIITIIGMLLLVLVAVSGCHPVVCCLDKLCGACSL